MKGASKLSMKARRNVLGYVFVLPALLCFVVFVLVPLILSLVISFYTTDMFFTNMTPTGFDNFARVFQDLLFWRAIGNILLYTLMAVPLNVILALVFASLVNSKIRGVKLFRVLFYLPSITSTVAASIVWLWLMNPAYGLLNNILTSIGLPAATWLTHSSTALVSVTIITVWQGVGGNMIIFVAALQNVPMELYEAAEIDGANKRQQLFHITLPSIRPISVFNLITLIIGAFRIFVQAQTLAGKDGNPDRSLLFMVMNIYNTAFERLAMGYESAMSWVFFAIVFVVSLVVLKATGRE